MTIVILFGVFILLIGISVPIGFAIGIASLLTILFSNQAIPLITLAQKAFTSLDSFPMLAIPLFIFAGIIMGKGGIARRLLDFAKSLVGFVTGGLSMVTIVACMFFAAISGSGPATVAAIGSIMIPSMKAKGYGDGFSTGVTAAAGSIGVIIPPSIPFIMFAVTGSVSVTDLFLAGIIPGILIGVLFMVGSYLLIKRYNIPVSADDSFNLKNVWISLKEALWGLLAPVIILGGIYGSIFTPTEAAAVACIYGILVGTFIYKELNWVTFYESLQETLTTTGTIMYIMGLSVTFAYILTLERVPQMIAEFMTSFTDSKFIILSIIIVLMIVVGMFIDTISAIVVLTPILLPLVQNIGVDPVHFGVIFVTSLALGYITPPVGGNLYVASQIGKVSFEKVVLGTIPFIFIMLIALILITFIPWLSLVIPSLIK